MLGSTIRRTYAIRLGIEDGNKFMGELNQIGAKGEKAMRRIVASTAPASAELRVLNNVVRAGRRNFAGLLSVIGSYQGLKTVVDIYGRFERGLIGVGKTADLAGRELKALGVDIEGLSKRIPVSADELLAIAQSAGQLGVKGRDNLLIFTETVAKLGTATNLAGSEAATALARILNVTGESVTKVDLLGSVIVALGNNFAATESEIADMATEVARASAVFDVGSAAAAGMGAAMVSLGIRSEVGGTTVGRVFRMMEAAIRGGGEKLEILSRLTGRAGKDFARLFGEDSVKAFQLFIQGLGRVEAAGGSTTRVLEELGLADQRILKALPVLAGRADLLTKALAMANRETENAVALNEEAERAFGTFESQMTLAANALRAVGRAIGEDLAPVILGVAEWLRDLSDNAGGVTTAFWVMTSSIAAVAGARVAGAAIVALGALRAQMVAAQAAGVGLASTMTAVRGVLAFLGGPWGVILGAASAALTLFVGNTDDAVDNLDDYSRASAKAAKETERLGRAVKDAGEGADLTALKLRAQRLEESIALSKAAAAALRELSAAQDQDLVGAGDRFTSSRGVTIDRITTARALEGGAGGKGMIAAMIEEEVAAGKRLQAELDDVAQAISRAQARIKDGLMDPAAGAGAVKVLEDLTDAREAFIGKLEDEVYLLGLDSREREIQAIVMAGQANAIREGNLLRAEEVKHIRDLVESRRALTKAEQNRQKDEAKVAGIYKRNRTALEKYNDAMEELQRLQGMGAFDEMGDTYWREQSRLLDEWMAAQKKSYDEALANSREFSAGALRAFKDYADGATNAARMAESATNSVMSGLEDALVRSRSLADITVGIAQDLQRLMIRQMITGPLAQGLSGWLDSAFSPGGASSGGSGGAVITEGWFAPTQHTGGIAGLDGTPRPVDPAVFADAPRFHRGGLPGLRANEVPAILERGEEVLTRNDPRHRFNMASGPGNITITVVNETGTPVHGSVEETPGGGIDERAFQVLLTPVVTSVIQGGAADTVLRRRFGLTAVPTRRG